MKSYDHLFQEIATLRERTDPIVEDSVSPAVLSRLDHLASLLHDCGHFAEALRYDEKLQGLLAKHPDLLVEVRSVLRACRSLVRSGRPEEARLRAERLLAKGGWDSESRAEIIGTIAWAFVKMGRFEKALGECETAARLARTEAVRGRIHLVEGWALVGLGRPWEALSAFRSAEASFLGARWDYGIVRALRDQAVVQKDLGLLGEAARSLRMCLRLLKKLSYPYLHAYTLHYLGNLNLRVGALRRARRRIDEALRLADLLGDPMLKASALVARARCLRWLGQAVQCRDALLEARRIAQQTNDSRTLALVWEEEGELARCEGDLGAAERAFQEGLAIARTIAPEGDIFAELARRLADVRIEQGRREEAKELAHQALDVSRKCGDRREEGTCYRTFGRIARTEGSIPRARDAYNRAVATFRLIHDRIELARTLEERATLETISEQDLNKARSLYRRAGIITDKEESRVATGRRISGKTAVCRKNDPFAAIVTHSPILLEKIETARRVASADCPVLLTGETGTGKELFARAIHEAGRPSSPFIALNCAALSENLLDGELFGHTAGAFTGATRAKRGLLEAAAGGTLFLDEIDKSSPAFQAKLLRFLDTGEVRRVGETETRRSTARVVSASNRNSRALSESGRLLPELIYRLRGVEIALPPLRERTEDIVLLAERFLSISSGMGSRSLRLADETIEALLVYRWPGNVRELKHEMERAVLLSEKPVVGPEVLALDDESTSLEDETRIRPTTAEERTIRQALGRSNGNVSCAAARLGLSRVTLYRRLRVHGIALSFYRTGPCVRSARGSRKP